MSSRTPSEDEMHGKEGSAPSAHPQRPGWADGLRQLYDSVVEEPLPDTFKNLLDRLDAEPEGESDPGRDNDGSDGRRN